MDHGVRCTFPLSTCSMEFCYTVILEKRGFYISIVLSVAEAASDTCVQSSFNFHFFGGAVWRMLMSRTLMSLLFAASASRRTVPRCKVSSSDLLYLLRYRLMITQPPTQSVSTHQINSIDAPQPQRRNKNIFAKINTS